MDLKLQIYTAQMQISDGYIYIYIQSLASAIRDVFTARESSIGSSGGTTEVRISVHSRNNL